MRPAVTADIPRLIKLGIAMHSESRYARFPVNLEKTERFFRMLLAAPQSRIIFLVDGDPIHALFIGSIQSFWWGDALESCDVLLYVSPEKRGGSSAIRLIREYKRIAESLGVADPKITTNTGIETERTGKFYERLGFEGTGLVYSLRP